MELHPDCWYSLDAWYGEELLAFFMHSNPGFLLAMTVLRTRYIRVKNDGKPEPVAPARSVLELVQREQAA